MQSPVWEMCFAELQIQIYSRRTETSVIYEKSAEAVAYLCDKSCIESCKNVSVDFLKSTLKSTHELYDFTGDKNF